MMKNNESSLLVLNKCSCLQLSMKRCFYLANGTPIFLYSCINAIANIIYASIVLSCGIYYPITGSSKTCSTEEVKVVDINSMKFRLASEVFSRSYNKSVSRIRNYNHQQINSESKYSLLPPTNRERMSSSLFSLSSSKGTNSVPVSGRYAKLSRPPFTSAQRRPLNGLK